MVPSARLKHKASSFFQSKLYLHFLFLGICFSDPPFPEFSHPSNTQLPLDPLAMSYGRVPEFR